MAAPHPLSSRLPAALRAAGLVLATSLVVAACSQHDDTAIPGDPERGRELLRHYGCVACHEVRKLDAKAMVGPPLDDIGARVYLAGILPNSPQNLAHWIRSPQSYKPGSAMPDLGVTQRDAQDMAAFLARLR